MSAADLQETRAAHTKRKRRKPTSCISVKSITSCKQSWHSRCVPYWYWYWPSVDFGTREEWSLGKTFCWYGPRTSRMNVIDWGTTSTLLSLSLSLCQSWCECFKKGSSVGFSVYVLKAIYNKEEQEEQESCSCNKWKWIHVFVMDSCMMDNLTFVFSLG